MPPGIYIRTKPIWNKGKSLTLKHRKKISIANKGKPGHHFNKGKPNLKNRGVNSPNWRGGITLTKPNGYILIKNLEHPFRNVRGYVLEHRLTMEKYLGRYLTSNEIVHHRNGIKTDNRLENLEVVLRTTHLGKVCCPRCQFEFKIK